MKTTISLSAEEIKEAIKDWAEKRIEANYGFKIDETTVVLDSVDASPTRGYNKSIFAEVNIKIKPVDFKDDK